MSNLKKEVLSLLFTLESLDIRRDVILAIGDKVGKMEEVMREALATTIAAGYDYEWQEKADAYLRGDFSE